MRRWGTEDVGLEEAYGRRVIGQGVRRSRLKLGWSQTQLGWRVGLHQSTVSRLESAHLRTMRMITLARIIGALRMTSLELFPDEPATASSGDAEQPAAVGGKATGHGPDASTNATGLGPQASTNGRGLGPQASTNARGPGPDAPPPPRRRLPGQQLHS